MTSSSILTIFLSTNSTFRKYSADSTLMVFLPMQTNVNSTSLPVNTSDICCHQKASPWPHTKFKSSKISQFHKKSILPWLCQFLPLFHLWIFQNHSSTYVSYPQGYTLAFL